MFFLILGQSNRNNDHNPFLKQAIFVLSYFAKFLGISGGAVIKHLPANTGNKRDMGLIPGLRRSPGGGHGNLLQYSFLENPMDRGTWWAVLHGVPKELDTT